MMQDSSGLARSLIVSTVGYPVYLSRMLMQLGYEPREPDQYGRLPNLYTYISIIRRERGFSALYTGLSYHLAAVVVRKASYDALSSPTTRKPTQSPKSISGMMAVCIQESVLKIYSCLVTYPLVTIGIGYVSSVFFGGKETIHMTAENLYKGIVPKLIIEVTMVWVTTISYQLTSLLVQEQFAQDLISRIPPFIVQSLIYPLNVCSTVMADNGRSGMNPKFSNLKSCFHYLKQHNQLKRGSAFLFRQDYQYIAGSNLPIRRYWS